MHRLALLCLLAATRTADASCALDPQIFGGSHDVPLGCPVVICDGDGVTTPQVFASRGTDLIDVTGAITEGSEQLDVQFSGLDRDTCEFYTTVQPHPFTTHAIELVGAEVGDVLMFGDQLVGTVVEAGACPAPMTRLVRCVDMATCDLPPEPVGDEPAEGGCSTGGSAGFAIGAALRLVRRRRHVPWSGGGR